MKFLIYRNLTKIQARRPFVGGWWKMGTRVHHRSHGCHGPGLEHTCCSWRGATLRSSAVPLGWLWRWVVERWGSNGGRIHRMYMQKLWNFCCNGGCTGIYWVCILLGGDQLQVRLGSSTLAKQTPETYHETDLRNRAMGQTSRPAPLTLRLYL